MSAPAIDRERLARVLGSDHDGEVLTAAARQASVIDRIVAKLRRAERGAR